MTTPFGISEFNPPIKPCIHNVAGRKVTVIRDDKLPAGTKQRYLPIYLSHPKFHSIDEFIYAGSSDGYGQIGLAYAAKLLGKKATIFVQSFTTRETPQTKKARALGAEIKGPYRERIQFIIKLASAYIEKNPSKRAWGLATDSRDTEATTILGHQIKHAFDYSVPYYQCLQTKPGKIFVIAGTAIIYTALKKAFPNQKFVLVKVGKTIWPDQVHPGDVVFESPFKFTEIPPAHRRPPYPAALNYDAKIYDAVAKLGEDGDWIWNIAG